VKRRATLEAYASEHLVKKRKSGRVTEHWLAVSQQHLAVAVEFFGAQRELVSVGVEHAQAYAHHLAERESARGGTLSPGSQRKYLNTLSNLFRRAQGEGLLRGANPVAALMDKPTAARVEAPWLEVWEGALLLESARTYPYGGSGGTAGERLREAIGPEDNAMATFLERMREAGSLATEARLRKYFEGDRIPTRAFLTIAARVLELAPEALVRPRSGKRTPRPRPPRFLHPMLATFLLTGGRESEVYGLLLGDVDLSRETITFRPHEGRRLKTSTSWRTVPYWPQLQEILEPHLEERRKAGAGPRDLVFVSARSGGMITDTRKALDAIAARAGWKPGEVRTKAFRHAYCSARLQTLDQGHPVAERTVAGEMGHGGYELVRRVYSHLGTIRHRSEVVEYRLEQQRAAIPPERLRLLVRIARRSPRGPPKSRRRCGPVAPLRALSPTLPCCNSSEMKKPRRLSDGGALGS
jgi:integrase